VSAPRKESQANALSALAMVGQLGLVMAVCVVGGVLAGVYVDRAVGGRGLVLVGGILLGLAAGGYGAYRVVSREMPWKR